jgi:hypothetical protein
MSALNQVSMVENFSPSPEGTTLPEGQASPVGNISEPTEFKGSPIYFVRIPKTASTSFTELLSRMFPPSEICLLQSGDVDAEGTLGPDIRRYRFVHGHMSYSLMDYFPEKPLVFTLLRDPVDRALSAFHYMRQTADLRIQTAQDGGHSKEVARQCMQACRMTLGEFIRFERRAAEWHLGNVQARLLSLTAAQLAQFQGGQPDCTDLSLAKMNLSACHAFGLMDRLQDFREMLTFALGLPQLGDVAWANKTRNRPLREDVDGETLKALEELTAIDQQLVAYARDLFEQRYRGMVDHLLRIHNQQTHHAIASEQEPVSSIHLFDTPPPGEGWYAPEMLDGRWFCWTGFTPESNIHLGTPSGTRFELRLEVFHAAAPENLFNLTVTVNGVQVPVHICPESYCHVVTASLEQGQLRGIGQVNLVSFRCPRPIRPCDTDPQNHDSRLLGISVLRAELLGMDLET